MKKITVVTAKGRENLLLYFLKILEAHDSLCLDSEDDRADLAYVLANHITEDLTVGLGGKDA